MEEDLFIIPLWKYDSIDEILLNKNFSFSKEVNKLILYLQKQKITKDNLLKIEISGWGSLEVENILEDASSEELENYVLSLMHMDKLSKYENEFDESYLVKKLNKKAKSDSIDDFLN